MRQDYLENKKAGSSDNTIEGEAPTARLPGIETIQKGKGFDRWKLGSGGTTRFCSSLINSTVVLLL